MVVRNGRCRPLSDDLRPLVQRLSGLQAGVGAAAALVGLAFWGRNVAISALAGGFIGVIANLYLTLRGLRPASTAASALGRLYFGQFVKMVVSVVLLYVAATRLPHVSVQATAGEVLSQRWWWCGSYRLHRRREYAVAIATGRERRSSKSWLSTSPRASSSRII